MKKSVIFCTQMVDCCRPGHMKISGLHMNTFLEVICMNHVIVM